MINKSKEKNREMRVQSASASKCMTVCMQLGQAVQSAVQGQDSISTAGFGSGVRKPHLKGICCKARRALKPAWSSEHSPRTKHPSAPSRPAPRGLPLSPGPPAALPLRCCAAPRQAGCRDRRGWRPEAAASTRSVPSLRPAHAPTRASAEHCSRCPRCCTGLGSNCRG